MQTILIVEADDHTLRRRADELLLDGYEPVVARSDAHARHQLGVSRCEALLLGALDRPPQPLALLRDLRGGQISNANPLLPTVTIGASNDQHAIRHYEAGADIVLPHDPSPLLVASALRALIDRVESQSERRQILRVGPLHIDCDARTATYGPGELRLTRLEFDLLEALARDPHRVQSREQLGVRVWHTEYVSGRTIDSHASRLRLKLTAAGARRMPETIRGVGYRLTR